MSALIWGWRRQGSLQAILRRPRFALDGADQATIQNGEFFKRQLSSVCRASLAPVRAQIPVGDMSLGDVMQASAAFIQVHAALNWPADNAMGLAHWAASARRVLHWIWPVKRRPKHHASR